MNNKKVTSIFFAVSLALLVGFAVVAFIFNRETPPDPAPHTAATLTQSAPSSAPAPAPTPVAPEMPVAKEPTPTVKTPPPAEPAQPELATAPIPDNSTPATPPPNGKKDPILDPDARAALSFVGVDPDAEDYWYGAINDPTLPAQERQDLIEDLNEDGISDPDHPGPQDLPLIENRLVILSQLAQDPMDQVNAKAIQEAAKDLSKMYADLTSSR